MPQLSAGQSASLVLAPGDAYTVSATGTTTVKGIYGAPSTTTTLTANFQTFGPYGVPAKLDIACVSGGANYSLVGAGVPATLATDPLTGVVVGFLTPGGGTLPVIVNSTFANLAVNFPASSNSGRICRITDMNNALFESNGTRWKPVNASALIGSLDTEGSMSGTTETIMFQKSLPAGILQNGDRLRLYFTGSKSGAAESATYTLRLGTSGTIVDPVIQTFSALVTTQISTGVLQVFKRLSATTVRKLGAGNSATSFASGGIIAALATPVAVSNMDSNAMFLSLTMTSSAAVETITVNDFTVELLSSAS